MIQSAFHGGGLKSGFAAACGHDNFIPTLEEAIESCD
jgi:hypothetical protein